MDTKKIFRRISAKLLEDFEISSEINHQGSKGTFRENALKKFLSDARLPSRYGLGSGEIVGPIQNVSKQSDLIIFDQLDGFSFVYDEATQVYPIECVFGVIEVKSTLDKTELVKSLENIKSVKKLTPNDSVSIPMAGGLRMAYKRPLPFGAIFAYNLGGNSLDSLVKNLKEWEQSNPKKYWPNVIAVLNVGLIFHRGGGFESLFSNGDIENAKSSAYINYGQDTLFKFYAALLDLCAGTKLGDIKLERYFDPAEQIGPYVVSNHNRILIEDKDYVFRLTESFISEVVNFCKAQGKITQKEFFIRSAGNIPQGMSDEYLDTKVFLYNPDNLKGIHEVATPFKRTGTTVTATEPLIHPSTYIVVDNEAYYIPMYYILEDTIEEIKGKKRDDL